MIAKMLGANAAFPFATLLSNVAAGFFIGVITGFERQSPMLSPNVKLFLTTGMMGGLSTFSTFSLETVTLFEKNSYFLAAGNILLNLVLCFAAVLIGCALARQMSGAIS
jgi:CrcB protein